MLPGNGRVALPRKDEGENRGVVTIPAVIPISRRGLLEATVSVLALVAAFAEVPRAWVERWYSTGLYPRLQHVLTPVSNLLPFAWLDVMGIAAVAAVLFALTRAGRAAWRARRPVILLSAVGHIAAVAAGLYLVFLIVWGFNYRRISMEERLVLDRGAPSSDAVVQLGLEAVTRLNELHAPAHAVGWVDDQRENAPLRQAFARVQEALSDAPTAVPGRLKRTALGPYFRWTGVDGMVNPFALEVLANPDLLPFERAFVAAHEWSHLAGYADESEANFVGWLACIRADVPTQYSGWLFLYWQINGEVGDEGRAALGAALGPGPRADIDAIIDRMRRGQLPQLRIVSWLVYDQYLKANRVEEGIRSYGAVVTLLLRARFDEGWTPVRRDGSNRSTPRP